MQRLPGVSSPSRPEGSGFALPFVWMLKNNRCDTLPKEKRKNVPLLFLQQGGFLLDP